MEEFFAPDMFPYMWLDFGLKDNLGKVTEFRMEYNQGCADANSGAYGTVWNRKTGKQTFMIEDYKADSESVISCVDKEWMEQFVSPEENFTEDELRDDSFLLNNYTNGHFSEKMIPIVMQHLNVKQNRANFYQEFVPTVWRIEVMTICLARIFSTRKSWKQIPMELIQLIASFAPAE